MTEKQYGGASSFGFKNKGIGNKVSSGVVVKTSKEKRVEIDEDSDEGISKDVLKNYMKSGEISKNVDAFIRTIVKKDVLLMEIAEKIEDKIVELGGKIAFPTNLSIDENAAHYTPVIGDITKASGLLKVDYGVEVEGFIADRAIAFDLTDDKRHTEMIKLNEFALESALSRLEIGSPVKVIGNTISEIVEAHNASPDSQNGRFKVIINLAGHGLDKDDIHSGLTVSNLKNENNLELRDMAIAIEPFLTTGRGEIYEGKPSEIYVLSEEKLPRDKDARNLLEFIIENYRTKPFCKRWLVKAGLTKFNFALSLLIKEGIVYNFPVLVEKEKKPVSQAEHTVIFADKVYITTK
jgi:methionyl aminopeptidase